MPKKTIETKTQEVTLHRDGGLGYRIGIIVDDLPCGAPVTVTYEKPEIKIRPGQRWRLEDGFEYIVTWKKGADSWWFLVNTQTGIIRTYDSYGNVMQTQQELQTWLNRNATIEWIDEEGE